MPRNDENESPKNDSRETPPALEWLIAAIGLILVAGTIGFLIYTAASKKDSPPDLRVETDSVAALQNGYLVKFSLYNDGENSAADVIIEGKLSDGEKELETSTVTIDYAPSHSRREGGLIFSKDPRGFDFKIRAMGYEKP